jgi:hypothetical protein
MNYRITSDFNAPFKVFTFFETENPYKLVFNVKVTYFFILRFVQHSLNKQ